MQIPAKKDWTVLYYLNGNNDLEPKLMRNLLDAEQVGSTDQVNLVAQVTRGPSSAIRGKKAGKTGLDGDWVGTRRYSLESHPTRGLKKKIASPVLSEQSKPLNAGESESLSDFISWGIKNYPAKKYMVIIGDHGKGFEGTGFDYHHKDMLDLPELKSALVTVRQETGVKPDVLVFDACEMGQLEVASQLRDEVGYMVASEEIIGAVGLPHRSYLEYLSARPGDTPRQAAQAWVHISQQDTWDRLDNDRDFAAVQLSAIEMKKVAPLEKALDQLAQALIDTPVAEIQELLYEVKNFNMDEPDQPAEDFRDLGHFCKLLQDSDASERVKKAAVGVTKALKATLVAFHNDGEEMEDATGMSVYLPDGFAKGKSKKAAAGYLKTDLAARTHWDEFLKDLAKR